MAKTKVAKVLWALDPFAEEDFGMPAGGQAARVLAESWGRQVEPVYLMSPEGFHFPGDFSSGWLKGFLPQLKETLVKKSQKYGGKEMLEPNILVSRTRGRRKDIKRLLTYAKQSGPAPVVLTTHGRKGLSRWVLGSFAETALLVARTPLLIVHPEHKLTQIKAILFPTNFSAKSKKFINKQIPWMKKNGIKAILYHKLANPVDPFVQSGMTIAGGGWVSFQTMMQEESLKRQKAGDKYCKELIAKGVEAQFIMDSEPAALEEGVAKAASKHKADLIGLLTEADAINANLIGSLARQLSRTSPCPLWIQHG